MRKRVWTGCYFIISVSFSTSKSVQYQTLSSADYFKRSIRILCSYDDCGCRLLLDHTRAPATASDAAAAKAACIRRGRSVVASGQLFGIERRQAFSGRTACTAILFR